MRGVTSSTAVNFPSQDPPRLVRGTLSSASSRAVRRSCRCRTRTFRPEPSESLEPCARETVRRRSRPVLTSVSSVTELGHPTRLGFTSEHTNQHVFYMPSGIYKRQLRFPTWQFWAMKFTALSSITGMETILFISTMERSYGYTLTSMLALPSTHQR